LLEYSFQHLVACHSILLLIHREVKQLGGPDRTGVGELSEGGYHFGSFALGVKK